MTRDKDWEISAPTFVYIILTYCHFLIPITILYDNEWIDDDFVFVYYITISIINYANDYEKKNLC